MGQYLSAVMERSMKVQEVILRAMAKTITWWQAAEIAGRLSSEDKATAPWPWWHRRPRAVLADGKEIRVYGR